VSNITESNFIAQVPANKVMKFRVCKRQILTALATVIFWRKTVLHTAKYRCTSCVFYWITKYL